MKTLPEMIAVMTAASNGQRIECRCINDTDWTRLGVLPIWDWSSFDYRIAIPQLPPKRIPLTAADFPPGTVLRNLKYSDNWYAVQAVGKDGLATFRCGKIAFHILLEDGNERSLDGGRTWLPCYKEQ